MVSVVVSVGSSPLTRGKRGAANDNARQPGLIPAHAGKTRPPGARRRRRTAHPRSRGENPLDGMVTRLSRGSSPLTRGKRGAARVADAAHGLIPAHAGKTARPRSDPYRAQAHPRSRGENQANGFIMTPHEGSSPLTRGKRRRRRGRGQGRRLIPAHAGKTFSLR